MKALIAIDGSPESAMAVETAAHLRWPDSARLDVLHVVSAAAPSSGAPWAGVADPGDEELRAQLDAAGRRLVVDAVERLLLAGVPARPLIRHGRAATTITEVAEDLAVDLVILGARGHGVFERTLVGSVSAEVVDHASRPVLIARRETTARILIGTDGSLESLAAISLVGRSGLFRDATVEVVHATDVHPAAWLGLTPGDAVFSTEAYGRVMDEAKRRAAEVIGSAVDLLRANGLAATSAALEGAAAPALVHEATTWEADLVVVGTRGRGAIERLLLGSTARSVLHHASASVLIVPGLTVRPGPDPERRVPRADRRERVARPALA